MKKRWLSALSLLMAATAFGGVATLKANAAIADVPEELAVSNVAAGKLVSYRSLADMNTVLDAYAYYPDGNGDAFPGTGSGAYGINWGDMARLTDGDASWGGFQAHSTAPGVRGWAFLDLGQEYAIDNIKLGHLASWCFIDVIVQVSNDPTFQTGVTTVFSTVDSLADGNGTIVYSGGPVTDVSKMSETGWNGFVGVDSAWDALRTYDVGGVNARYVRVTNNTTVNGGATQETVFTEIQVEAITSGIFAPKASVAPGFYETLTAVELTAVEGAEIYYTTDGSYPTKNSTKYEGAIDVTGLGGSFVIRATAVVDGKQSEAADFVYKIAVPSTNRAFGKIASFRSLTDMDVVVEHGSYFPDNQGFYGENFEGGSLASLTDGIADWGSAQNRAPQTANTHAWVFLDLGEEIAIDNIKVGFLAYWCFQNVVIQVSNDPTFQTGVTTVFACTDVVYADDGVTVVYNGGQVGCSAETRAETGWNGFVGVDSNSALLTYRADGVSARYVRLTNADDGNGGAQGVTTITELQVYNVGGVVASPVIKDTVKSVAGVPGDFTVVPGANVLADLPATVTVTTMAGVSKEVAVDWTSADYNPNANGVYTFTGAVAVDCDDVFEVLPEALTVRVTVEKTDTTALEALVAETRAMDNTVYTAKTWAKVETALAKADEAIANVAVTPEAVASITEEINGAIAALEELATDKTELATAIATATAMDANDYMSASIEGLAGVLAAAEAVNANTDASKAEVANALSALTAEIGKAVLKGDTTALAALIAEIEAENYVEENFTPLTWATLEDKLEDAREIVAKTETPKTVVDEAYEALAAAKAGLVAYGNNAELAALVEACDALVEADYTAGSYAVLTAELAEASALLEEKLMQDEIDAAKAELQAAKDGLVSLVALKAAIATTIDETLYTAISVQAWKDAKAEAQLVLDNPNATAEEVAGAVAAIEEAANGLTEIPVENSSSDINSDINSDTTSDSDGEESSKDNGGMLSCGGVIGSELAVALLGAVAVVLKKKKD